MKYNDKDICECGALKHKSSETCINCYHRRYNKKIGNIGRTKIKTPEHILNPGKLL